MKDSSTLQKKEEFYQLPLLQVHTFTSKVALTLEGQRGQVSLELVNQMGQILESERLLNSNGHLISTFDLFDQQNSL